MSTVQRPCPNCGAPIDIDARWTRLAVCTTCRSAVTFDAEAAKVAGTLSVLPPSRTQLFSGAQGRIQGRDFQVLGRVRYGYDRGYWDEWHVLWLDDGSTGWLSEDEERIVIEELALDADTEVRPDTEAGSQVSVLTSAGPQAFTVVERGTASVDGGEGQLPFQVVQGEQTPFVDLRSTDGATVASVEFGEAADGGRRVFVGQPVGHDQLELDWTRQDIGVTDDIPLATKADGSVERLVSLSGGVHALKCKACAGGLEVAPGPDGKPPAAVECAYCGTVNQLDGTAIACPNCEADVPLTSGDQARTAHCGACGSQITLKRDALPEVAGKSRRNKTPRFKPGSTFQWRDVTYDVTGFLGYAGYSEGEHWFYEEYALYAPGVGYRWLVESDGEWSFSERVFDVGGFKYGDRPDRLEHRGQSYRTKEANKVTVDIVAGELPWVAKVGDKVWCLDTHQSGKYSLSVEATPDEVEWYLCESVPRGHIYKSTPSARPKRGVAEEPRWTRQIMVLAFIVSLACFLLPVLVFNQSADKLDSGELKGKLWGGSVATTFEVKDGERPVRIGLRSSKPMIDGGWAYYRVKVKKDGGEQVLDYTTTHTQFYHGGGWPPAFRHETAVAHQLAPGKYTMEVSGAASGWVTDARKSTATPVPRAWYSVTSGRELSYPKAMTTAILSLILAIILLLRVRHLQSEGLSRAQGPRLPGLTIFWALILAWGVARATTPEVNDQANLTKPSVAAVPVMPVVVGYTVKRLAFRSARKAYSVRTGSSSSSRSYGGGGYSSGK